jgi:UPF0716 protein FxsA
MRFLPLLLPLTFFIEIWLMIEIGSRIGALAAITWLIAGLVLGVNILRFQGAASMMRAAEELRAGITPAQTLADGLLKSLGAVLLIIPGFGSDLLAIFFFIPFLRRLLLRRWQAKFAQAASFNSAGFSAHFDPSTAQGHVYEHQGDASKSSGQTTDLPAAGHILEHEPDKKD